MVIDSDQDNAAEKKFTDRIGSKADKKLRARKRKDESFLFWLGMMGMVGWAVAIRTLMGIGIGLMLDSYFPMKFSWTLTLLLAGVVLGCFNAWYWINKERG